MNAPGGYFDFSHLTTDNIDRIEIVRGPASVLYGADAVSGIVQIFTRKGSGESRGSIGVRGGTYHSIDVDADAVGSTPLGGFSLGAAPALQRWNSAVQQQVSERDAERRADARTGRSGRRQNFRAIHRRGVSLSDRFYRPAGRQQFIPDPAPPHRWVRRREEPDSRIQARLLAGSNDVTDLTEDIAIPFGSSTPAALCIQIAGLSSERRGPRRVFSAGRCGTLTVGTAYEQEHENSSNGSGAVGGPTVQTDSFDASRHNIAYYSELLGDLTERFSYTLSGRVDDNSDYDRFGTYRLGANAGVLPAIRVRASLSTAFNAPAFNQLRPTLYTVGSPNLRPERSRSAEIGLTTSFHPELIRIGASYFTQHFSDLIQYVNGGAAELQGQFCQPDRRHIERLRSGARADARGQLARKCELHNRESTRHQRRSGVPGKQQSW